jgi:hypothetical protein
MLNKKQQLELTNDYRQAIKCLMEINNLCSNDKDSNLTVFKAKVALTINGYIGGK